jgi:hypothetical protein
VKRKTSGLPAAKPFAGDMSYEYRPCGVRMALFALILISVE